MDSRELIDAQFQRAVDIVQSLPKTGPIQTGYEEKLTMYSLYKQATQGNVKSSRPGMWDMLGRAKWDEWAKHKDLPELEAKWLYVEALLKVLRKYSDKTVARDLVQEIESYGGDPSNLVMSRTSRRTGSVSSGSTQSDISPMRPTLQPVQAQDPSHEQIISSEDDASDSGQSDEEYEEPAPLPQHPHEPPPSVRPQSSLSASRYRTPVGGSLVDARSLTSPPAVTYPPAYPPTYPHAHPTTYQPLQEPYPVTQPHPGFETPSAFSASSPPASSAYPLTYPYPSTSQLTPFTSGTALSPPYPVQGVLPLPNFPPSNAVPLPGSVPLGRPESARPPFDAILQSVQAHLAALSERIDVLEHSTHSRNQSPSWLGSASRSLSMRDPGADDGGGLTIEDMGMWGIVLHPLSRALRLFRQLMAFVARKEPGASPALIVVRRLFLDISFVLCVLALVRLGWRKSGVRRKEVKDALVVLWRAVVGGTKAPRRRMVDRGV